MPRLSFMFFALAALCALVGMVWGMVMGASGDHAMLAAHAHLNLLGWVGLALMGTFHALAAGRVPSALGWTNLALSTAGAIALPIGLVLLAIGTGPRAVPLVIFGGASSTLGMAVFLSAVIVAWRNPAPRS